jgi:hypothetical protein
MGFCCAILMFEMHIQINKTQLIRQLVKESFCFFDIGLGNVLSEKE